VLVAATLRVAEHIAAGTERIGDLAAATGCDPYALHRVLTHLVSRGVFEEPSPGQFALNDAARQLLDPAARLGLDLDGIGGRMAHAWATLLSYVRTRRPAYDTVFGLPFWDDLQAHPAIAASFDALIGPPGHGAPDPEFEIVGGWKMVHTVVDVGGGTGAMLAALLRLRPALSGILVDLPRTAAQAFPLFEAAGVAARAAVIGQSFFDPLPAGADLYLLRGILNDWPDREAAVILSRCVEAAGSSGRVVVLGGISPDDTPRDLTVEMVLLGGKHRSLSEFRALTLTAGLEVIAASRQPSGRFVVECRQSVVP
jgi:hypothetical protein